MVSTQIDVYPDYVCPFCFLVEDAIEEVKQDGNIGEDEVIIDANGDAS